jgi:integrase
MPTVNLNDRLLRRLAQGAAEGRETYHDAGVPELSVRVTTTGRRTFSVRYRAANGTRRRKTLGVYPNVTLAAARAEARKVLGRVAGGEDPVERTKREGATVADFTKVYLDRYAKAKKKTWAEDKRQLARDVLPLIGRMAVTEVRRGDLIRIVDRVADRGAGVQANRTAALLSKFFAFARDRGLIELSPAQALPRPTPERAKDRVLTDDEIRKVWGALDDERPGVAAALRLVLLTAARPGEVLGMRQSELDGEWWTIPAERTKAGRAHRVLLSTFAFEVLHVAIAAAEKKAKAKRVEVDYIFPNPRADGSVRWLSHAGARIRENATDVAHWTPHDLRRTAATGMEGLGVSRFVVARILNHADPSVTAVYARHGYDDEKRAALQRWGEHVRAIVDEAELARGES